MGSNTVFSKYEDLLQKQIDRMKNELDANWQVKGKISGLITSAI